jgi:hypothetical protein
MCGVKIRHSRESLFIFLIHRAATLEQTIENQDAELQNLTTALENWKASSKVNIRAC